MPLTPNPLAMALDRMGRAYLGSGAEFWARSWEIWLRHWATPAASARGSGHRSEGGRGGRTLLDAYRHYVTEMAMVPGLAVERFGAELAPRSMATPERAVTVMGRSIPLPARAKNATEGVAIYAVEARAARAVLDEGALPFVPVDLGHGGTALGIFGARYLVSDLGAYDEVGLGLFVAPRRDPLDIGLYYLALTANTPFSCAAAREVWGVAKTEETVEVALGESQASWTVRRRVTGNHLLTITFPRGGRGSSTAIPLSVYTMLGGRPHRAMSVRTGRGERVLAGAGQVTLTLGGEKANADDRLWKTLRRLGLPAAPLILHAWTERMSGELAAPIPLREREVAPFASS